MLDYDANLVEINPLAAVGYTSSAPDHLVALDSKVILDDNAAFRHPERPKWFVFAKEEHDENELLASEAGLSYVQLDGNIGCIVNGAGLAMATMDMIKLFNGEPANFLDVGGSSNPQKVVNAIKIITRNPKVKAILINIFGGITRCDDIANGLIEAINQVNVDLPIVVRLTGTNEDIARKMLDEAQIPNLTIAQTMKEAVEKVVSLAS